MKKIFLLLATPLIFGFGQLCAQENSFFPEYTKIEIPENLLDEPIVILENRTTLDYLTDADFRRLLYRRAIIQNQEGVEEYSKMFINTVNNETIDRLEMRTIKPDGKIMTLHQNDIIKTRHQESTGYYTVNGYKIIVPNLEIGDVVDLYYSFAFNRIEVSQEVYFAQKYPTLTSTIEIRNASRFDVNIFPENGDPKGEIFNRDLMKVYKWTKTNLPGIGADDYTSKSRKLEHINCYLWKKDQVLSYRYFYSMFAESFVFDEFSFSIVKELQNKGIYIKGESPVKNLSRFNDFIDTAFTWESIPQNLNGTPVNDWFEKKIISYTLRDDYWNRYLKLLKIDYIMGYTRSKYKGPIAENYFIFNHLDIPFYIVTEDERPYYFFLPERERTFKVNEIPFEFEFNNAVLFYHSYKKKDATDVKFMDIPASDFKINIWNSRKMLSVENGEVQLNRQDNWTGAFSQIFRKPLDEGKYPFDVDDVLKNSKITDSTFIYNIEDLESKCGYNWVGTTMKLSDELSKNLFQFEYGKALIDFHFDVSNKKRINDVFLPFGYRIKDNLYITFDFPIKLIQENDEENSVIKNDTGFFSSNISQVDSKTIAISVQYGIFGSIFLSDKVSQLTEIGDLIKKLPSQSFVYEKL